MHAITKKCFVWLWMASLWVATTGITIQEIYCYCLEKTVSAGISLPDAGFASLTSKSCCQPEKTRKSCCREDSGMEKSHGCTKKSTRVFQLKTEFVLEKQALQSPGFSLFPIHPGQIIDCFAGITGTAATLNKAPPPLPLPISGRTRCIRQQFFLC
jgi:hypothetical protein